MFRNATLLIFLCLLVVGGQPMLAAPKPDPPTVPSVLNSEQVNTLQRAWRRDGMPTLELVLGQVQENGQPVMQNTPIERKLRAAILRELGRGIDGSRLVDETALRTQQLRDRRALGVDLGVDASSALKQIMVDGYESGMIMMVRLMPRGVDQYAITMETIDPASAGVLASQPFLDIRSNADAYIVDTYAASIAGHFVKQYSDRVLSDNGPLYTMRFTIVGLDDARDARRLTRALQRVDGVPENARIEHTFERVQAGMQVATYTVPTTQVNTDYLQDDMHDAIEDMMPDHVFVASRAGRGSMIGAVYRAQEPRWWQATNLRDNQPIRTATQQREQAKGLNRRLGVAVVIGPDVEASASIVEDPSIKLENTFDEAALQGELQTMLTQVGFDAVHDVALKDAKRLAQRQMSRFVNMENLEFAADDKKNFEYLLYGNLSEGEGGTRYEFRLIDRQTGAVVGTQRWPDSRYYNAPPRYRDDPDELRAMSRYVTGQLMTQLDARLIDDRLVMEVVVKNVGDIVDIAALADLFKDDPNVIDVGTFNYSMPIGGFEIVYRGSRDNLMDTLRIELPELETPMLVDLYSDRQLVINLRRDVTPQPDVPQEPRAVVPVRKTPPPSEQPVKRDNPLKPVAPVPPAASTESLENHVRRASESVWLIVSEIRRNGYIITRTGTAWTVRDNMLATNAHVVKGLANEMQDAEEGGGSVKFFAVKNTNSSVRLELGKVLIHPEYSKTSYAGSAADFALIEVTKGNPGNPLTLAQQQELDMLRPLQRVGYAGFPSGDIRKWGADTVNMQMDVGTISSIGDASLRPTTRTTRRVLTYTIRTRSGASGSPVIGAGGTVIAIHAWGDGADVSFEVRGRDGNVERDQKGQVKTSDIFVSTGFSRGATIDVLSSWLADLDRSGSLP